MYIQFCLLRVQRDKDGIIDLENTSTPMSDVTHQTFHLVILSVNVPKMTYTHILDHMETITV